MKKLKRLIMVGVVLLGVLGSLLPSTALAIVEPTTLSVDAGRAFDNLFVTGDLYFVARYDLNYTANPTEPPTNTFDMLLYQVDNVTPLYSTTVKYYGHGIIGMYLNPAQAATLTWGDAYYLKIEGDPAYFTPPLSVNTTAAHSMIPIDWWSGTQAVSRENLRVYCQTAAAQLQVALAITLIGTSGKLNAAGTAIFTTSLPGIELACPTLFEVISVNPVLTSANRTVTLEGTIVGIFTGGEIVRGSISGVTGTFIAGTQNVTRIQVLHSEVEVFFSGENVTGDASGAIITVTGVLVGKLEAISKSFTGNRLRNTLNSLGILLGMSGNAVGGIILMIFYLLVAGAVFVATGSTSGAIAISLPVLFFGNYIGVLAFAITWLLTIIAVTLFSILFIMERLP